MNAESERTHWKKSTGCFIDYATGTTSSAVMMQTSTAAPSSAVQARSVLVELGELVDLGACRAPSGAVRDTETPVGIGAFFPNSRELARYTSEWVAIQDGRVVAHGLDRAETRQRAILAGGEPPVMIRVHDDPSVVFSA